MNHQIQQAQDWALVATEVKVLQLEKIEYLEFSYDGAELDQFKDQLLIQDFLEHVQWYLSSKMRYYTILGLMLMKTNGH